MDPTSGQSSITVVFFVVGKGSARRQPSILHVQACIGRWMWQLLWMNPLFCGKRCADKSSGNTSYFIWCSMPLLCKGIDLEAINWDVSSILVGMEDCFWFWNIRLTYLGLFWNFQPSNDRFEKPQAAALHDHRRTNDDLSEPKRFASGRDGQILWHFLWIL